MSPYYATIKEKNLTVNELLSIASLVEKEGAKTEDRKKIAGVFYNRLNLRSEERRVGKECRL